MSESESVFVEAPARLHMGLLDLRGELGRRFGGIGAALDSPSLLLEAEKAERLTVEGEDADRIRVYATRFLERHGIATGGRLRLHRGIPPHTGLGSGTQLALATARALSALYRLEVDVPALAAATGRGERSAIGTWAFAHGGFLLDGGRREGSEGAAPLLMRREMPLSWRCVVAIPGVPRGLSGAAEEAAFRSLPTPPEELVGRIARLVLMVILPGLVEEDLPAFGRGVTDVQRLVGEMFLPVQGERFAHPQVSELIQWLLEQGAAGAGQSSWGPAVFGLFPDDQAGRGAVSRLRPRLPEGGEAFVTSFNNAGGRCWAASGREGQKPSWSSL
jgi:beta-RFAP synthase